MSDKPAANLMPALYSWRLHEIVELARMFGYAIAVHGSMQRDLDLVAIPWTDEARPASDLVDWLCDNLGAMKAGKPGYFPHGRVVYSLEMGGCCFMDLSVMPLTTGDSG